MAKTKAKAKAKPVKTAKPPASAPKKVTVASKTSTKPSIPLPPPPDLPPPPRDEMIAPRDIARLTRYGERFGAQRIDVRMLPAPLPVASGSLAICDPAVPKSWRVFDRPTGAGQFRTMLSVARDEAKPEKLAAIVVHVGRPPIARWTVAHFAGGKKPKSADQLPRMVVTAGWIAIVDGGAPAGVIAVPETGGIAPVEIPLSDGRKALALACGNGEFAAYWAVDATDKPICLVIDFDRFTAKDWKSRPPT